MGASPGLVVRQVLSRTAGIVGIGSLAGMILALVSARLVGNLFLQASPQEPIVLIGTALAMAVVGVASAVMPARRAVSVEPLRAVRSD